jgi:hypothetical protein
MDLWEPSMETSHMLRISITDRSSTNLQVFVASQQHFVRNAYAHQYRLHRC